MIHSILVHSFHRYNIFLSSMVLLSIFIALVITGCSSQPPMLTTPNSMQVAMENAGQLRSQAEQRVLLLKNQQSNISLNDYQSAQSMYDTARSSFDLWINQLQADLKSGKPVDNPDNYNVLVETASTQAKNFNDYVDQLLQVAPRGDEAKNSDLFVDAGIKLLQTVQKIDRKKRLALVNELEALRWQAFDLL